MLRDEPGEPSEHSRAGGNDDADGERMMKRTEDPRAGGDDSPSTLERSTPSGRSPRRRGRRDLVIQRGVNVRKIPAQAGTTPVQDGGETDPGEDPRADGDDPPRGCPECPEAEDPRAGGDDISARSPAGPGEGRSPRRRGRRRKRCRSGKHRGEDPRAGGDDASRAMHSLTSHGRSPRRRVRHQHSGACGPEQGKIPARAGTTGRCEHRPPGWGEDPRAGGDDSRSSAPMLMLMGRSPRGRGRLSSCRPRRARTTEDPRAGGDDISGSRPYDASAGRSPRGRGRRGGSFTTAEGVRKIPARAGTTSHLLVLKLDTEEDPRAGGDDHPHATEVDP